MLVGNLHKVLPLTFFYHGARWTADYSKLKLRVTPRRTPLSRTNQASSKINAMAILRIQPASLNVLKAPTTHPPPSVMRIDPAEMAEWTPTNLTRSICKAILLSPPICTITMLLELRPRVEAPLFQR